MLKDCVLKETIKQISYEEFQFTAEEVIKLFSKRGARLSQYDAGRIQNQTMGWPIALSALLLSGAESEKAGLSLNRKN